MEIFKVVDSKKNVLGYFATERENDNVEEDIVNAYERAIDLLKVNPDENIIGMLESCLEDVDIIMYYPQTINLPPARPKVLLIIDDNDTDLIVEDGGYACFYTVDGKVKVDLHQGRITEPISDERTPEDIVHDNCDKQYFDEIDGDILTDELLERTLQWLVVGSSLDDFKVIRKSITEIDYNEEINSFLNL